MNGYRKRIIDDILKFKLEAMGAVLIQGMKGCGKTTAAEETARSSIDISRPENADKADIDPDYILKGETPRLLDEWKTVPKLFDYVRREVDRRDGDGQFILTGSAVPAASSKIVHSGVGRYAFLKMRPMSF